jgi:drug/metabolite transporter (DMT)-like permease
MGETLALLSALCFSGGSICVSIAQRSMNSNKGLFISLIANLLFMAVLMPLIWLFDSDPVVINWMAVAIFIVAGFFTGYLGRLLNFFAMERVGPARMSVMKLTIPLFVFFIAFGFLGESLTMGDLIASLLIMVGLFWINLGKKTPNGTISKKESEAAQQELASSAEIPVEAGGRRMPKGRPPLTRYQIGIGIALLSCLSYAVGNSLRKIGLMHWPDPFIGTLIGAIVAMLVFILAAVLRGQGMAQYWSAFKEPGRGFFALAGVLMILAHLAIFGAYTLSSLSIATLLSFVEPIFTIPLAYLFLKKQEQINVQLVIGAVLVVIGVSILFIF